MLGWIVESIDFDNGITCNFREPNTKVIFSILWDETIMELEPEIRNMVLYDAKLTLERDMEGYVRAYQLVKNGGFGSRVITIGWL